MKNTWLIFILIFQFAFSQQKVKDSTHFNLLNKKVLIPISLIGSGLIINKSHFENTLQHKIGGKTNTNIENYLLLAPIASMYIADIKHVKSENNWFNQSKYLFISNALSIGIVEGIKKSNGKLRPNGLPDSFPSGHSAVAFTNATVLYHEFHKTTPLLAYSGYLFASTVGAFRIFNNKHYLSDVLVGAGIGIAITNLVYYFKPLKNFNPFYKVKNMAIFPSIKENTYGVMASYQF
ncbi:MAG: phosphatase PAP2 family protein [Lutibacter sp.]